MSDTVKYTNSHGSGTGISFYSVACECSRKARLKREKEDIIRQYEDMTGADAGSLFHKYMEGYYGTDKEQTIEVDDLALEPALNEANRLYQAYTQRFPRTFFGKVLGTEVQLPPDGDPGAAARVCDAVGVAPFTCRIDMVVELGPEDVSRLQRLPGMGHLTQPGVYLVDHKTAERRNSMLDLEYNHSAQMIAYQLAWNAVNPSNPCNGVIINQVVKHMRLTDASFELAFVRPPTDIAIAGLKKWLQWAKLQAETDCCNWKACFNYHRPCAFLVSGDCNRI